MVGWTRRRYEGHHQGLRAGSLTHRSNPGRDVGIRDPGFLHNPAEVAMIIIEQQWIKDAAFAVGIGVVMSILYTFLITLSRSGSKNAAPKPFVRMQVFSNQPERNDHNDSHENKG